MNTNDACLDGPFQIELKIRGRNGTEDTAEVTYTLPPGMVPTNEDFRTALKVAADTLAEHDYALMTRHEFVNSLLPDVGTGTWAVGGPDSFRLLP